MELVIKPSGFPESKGKPWLLCLRVHDLGGTDYLPLVYVSDAVAKDIIEAGAPSWLYGEPDWAERERLKELEKARILHGQALEIEQKYAKS